MVDAEFIRRRMTELSLPDGTRLRLRPIVPEDKALLVAGFERMSPESRYRRFMAPLEELTPELLTRLTEVDYRNHFAWVALALDDPVSQGVGVARYVRPPDEPEVAEAAVTVIDDYHGRGIGTLLLQALGAVALENGVRRFRSYAVEDNVPLRELMESLGAHAEHEAPGVMRVEVDLPEREHAVKGTPLYEVLRAVARGEGPRFLPAGLDGARA